MIFLVKLVTTVKAALSAHDVDIKALIAALNTVFENQPDATLSQANPVSGTKYTVLDTTENVRILSIRVFVTWSAASNKLQAHVTIDDVTMVFGFIDPDSNTNYFANFNAAVPENSQILETTDRLAEGRPFLLEGRSVKVEIETTGGTVSQVLGKVKYAKIP